MLEGPPSPSPRAADRGSGQRSCADWLDFVAPHLDPRLIDPSLLARARIIASRFPEDCMAVLEAPLGAEKRGLDISFRVDPDQADRVAARLPEGPVASLLRHWRQTPEAFRGLVNLWLEFDLHDPKPEPEAAAIEARPIICARLRPGVDALALLDELWSKLEAPSLGTSARGAASHCLHLCSRLGGRALYLFALLSRPGSPARLELVGLGPEAMVRLADELMGEGAASQVREAVDLVPDADRHHLSLDIWPAAAHANGETHPWSTRIGVEASYERLPSRDPRWQHLFDRLVAAGLCEPAKSDASFLWPGQDGRRATDWPAGKVGHCARCLSHVKLVTRPDSAPFAKVYLLYQYLRQRPAITRDHGSERKPAIRGS